MRSLGFMALDLLRMLPEAVEKPANDRKAFYFVACTMLVTVLTQATQER